MCFIEVTMARNDIQVNFRMPHEIVDSLKTQAMKERRSVTAQINLILEEWFREKNQKESAKA